jgi:prophage antirepressor-like protein
MCIRDRGYNFWASGTDVCNYLTYANHSFSSYDGTYSYSTDGSVTCDEDSDIIIKLYFLEE